MSAPGNHNGDDKLWSSCISRCFAIWITEALALSTAGMPANSFSLVFDGDPVPDRSSEEFDIVKGDAAWQVAQDQWYNQQSVYPDWSDRRSGEGVYFFEDFPQAITNIVEGKSCISCIFPIGGVYDVKPVFD
jgi:hypothetical protein